MDDLHAKLKDRFSWYRSWHDGPHTSMVHIALLAAFGAVMVLGTLALAPSADENNFQDDLVAASQGAMNRPDRSGEGLSRAYLAWKQKDKTDEATKELVAAAQQRKNTVLQALQNGELGKLPKLGLSSEMLGELPEELDGLIEEEVELTGELVAVHGDVPDKDEHVEKYFLARVGEEKKNFNLHFVKGKADFVGGETVRVKGYKLDNHLVAQSTDSSSLQLVAQSPTVLNPEATTGAIKYTTILFNFSDDTSQPYTVADIQNRMYGTSNTSVNGFFKETSYGKASITGNTHGWFTVPYSKSQCSSNMLDITFAAIDAAKAKGVDTSGRLYFVFPYSSACGFAGASTMGGYYNWSYSNGYVDLWVMGHEVGHSFGTPHAGAYNCGSVAVAPYTNCSWSEYGDPFDIMGNSRRNNRFNASQTQNLKWFAPSNVQTVMQSGVYKIAPLGTATNEVQTLRIAKPDSVSYTPPGISGTYAAPSPEYYYLEYRQPTGVDSNLPAQITGGALLHARNDSNYVWQSRLFDLTPGDNDFTNAALSDGQTFTDTANGITIKQISHDASGVTLDITVPGQAACTAAAPVVAVTPDTAAIEAGLTSKFTVSLKNNDSATCDSATFTLSSNVSSGLTGTISPSTLTVAPGGTGTAVLYVAAPLGTAAGSYPVSVAVTGGVDVHKASDSASLTVVAVQPDTTAPTVVITSPKTGDKLKGASANVSVSATDNKGMAKVEFLINGALVSTDMVLPYAYKWNIKKVPAGQHTITARAYDTSGNMAETSVQVTK